MCVIQGKEIQAILGRAGSWETSLGDISGTSSRHSPSRTPRAPRRSRSPPPPPAARLAARSPAPCVRAPTPPPASPPPAIRLSIAACRSSDRQPLLTRAMGPPPPPRARCRPSPPTTHPPRGSDPPQGWPPPRTWQPPPVASPCAWLWNAPLAFDGRLVVLAGVNSPCTTGNGRPSLDLGHQCCSRLYAHLRHGSPRLQSKKRIGVASKQQPNN
mmetsp:Transcript_74554/g.199366  ORF Transcript_74554/g.199366 Transcript_74554/m.199366 type:complete len:214 (+) Transcript_74554:263-904(+)